MNIFHSILILLCFNLHFINAILCPTKCICKNRGKYVSCKNNNFKSIPHDIPTNVEILDLTHNIFNNLSSNAFITWTNLRELRLDHCEIKSIDKGAFTQLQKLKNLYLTNNDIERLNEDTFKSLKQLLHVYLGNNEFETVPPLKSFSITRLNLDGNHINNARIDDSFQVNTALRTLVLTNNKIGSLNKTDFVNLRNTGIQSLMLKMNNIEFIHPEAFTALKYHLQTLELEGNQLLGSKQLEAAISGFSGAGHIIFLDLRNTGLTVITRTFFQPLIDSKLHRLDIGANSQLNQIDEDAFHELNHVQVLIADKCKISSANIRFSALSSLKEVDLSHNNLDQCPHRLPGLVEKVNLAHNNIRRILKDDLKSLSSLKYLNLANNAITIIEEGSFSDLVQLNFLDLSYNRLETVEPHIFISMSSLSILHLYQQNPCLKHVDVDSFLLPNLLTLDLGRNCIDVKTLDSPIFSNCPRLANISLNSNTIEYLKEPFFKNCRNLSFLDFSYNKIRGWSPQTFIGISATLVDLRLSFNNLVNLSTISSEENYLPNNFNKLQTVSLENNHWNCSCEATRWILAHKLFLRNADKIICNYPNSKNGRKLFDQSEMKDCKVTPVFPGPHNQQIPNNAKIISIFLSVIFMLVFFGLIICFRKALRRISGQLIRNFRQKPYTRMPNSNDPESPRYVNPRFSDNVVSQSNLVNEKLSYTNTIMDEEVPEIDRNCLIINDSNYSDSSDCLNSNNWVSLVRLSSYESGDDIVFLSTKMNLETSPNISVNLIHNLQSFDNKIAAFHCAKLVIDYPLLDLPILKEIINERRNEIPADDEEKGTYMFHSCDIEEDEYDELCQVFGVDNITEYTPSNINDKFFKIF